MPRLMKTVMKEIEPFRVGAFSLLSSGSHWAFGIGLNPFSSLSFSTAK